jgi:hypothetical protein
MVEIFFGVITRQAIRRGSYSSVKDLISAIGRFIDGWNERSHPFVWTKPADDLLDHCRPGQRTSFPRHQGSVGLAPQSPDQASIRRIAYTYSCLQSHLVAARTAPPTPPKRACWSIEVCVLRAVTPYCPTTTTALGPGLSDLG